MDFSAVVLAGGTAARMGGIDKASIELGGLTFLERAIGAVVEAVETVVVGPEVPTSRPVTFVREDPPLGGPAAGVVAGRDGFARVPTYVVVLAVDMPLVTAATVGRVLAAARGHDGAVLVEAGGRRQPVLAVTAEVLPPRGTDVHGRSLWSLVEGRDLIEVGAVGSEAAGVDTWDELRDLRTDHGE